MKALSRLGRPGWLRRPHLRLRPSALLLVALVIFGLVLVGAYSGGAAGPVFGFILGLAGALLVQSLVAQERRRRFARVARDMIVTEAMFNLRELHAMNESLIQTATATTPMLVRSTGTGLRKTVFERLIAAEVLDAVSVRESGYMVQSLYELGGVQDAAETFYDRHRQRVEHPELAGAADFAARKALQTWRSSVLVCGMNLMNLMLLTLHNNDGPLRNDKARGIAAATLADREFWRLLADENPEPNDTYLALRASSDFQRGTDQSKAAAKGVVCWEHDWPECPVPVIALAPIAFPDEHSPISADEKA